MVPLTGLSRGGGLWSINCFIKSRFGVPLTPLYQEGEVWDHINSLSRGGGLGPINSPFIKAVNGVPNLPLL